MNSNNEHLICYTFGHRDILIIIFKIPFHYIYKCWKTGNKWILILTNKLHPTQLSFTEAIQVDNLFIEGKLTHLELGYIATPQHQSRFQVIYLYHLCWSDVMEGRNNAFSFIKPLNRYEIYIDKGDSSVLQLFLI